jgi:hypothetical protein
LCEGSLELFVWTIVMLMSGYFGCAISIYLIEITCLGKSVDVLQYHCSIVTFPFTAWCIVLDRAKQLGPSSCKSGCSKASASCRSLRRYGNSL